MFVVDLGEDEPGFPAVEGVAPREPFDVPEALCECGLINRDTRGSRGFFLCGSLYPVHLFEGLDYVAFEAFKMVVWEDGVKGTLSESFEVGFGGHLVIG